MKVLFKLTSHEAMQILDEMTTEQAAYYGRKGANRLTWRQGCGLYSFKPRKKAPQRLCSGGFGWRSSRGNDLYLVETEEGWTAEYSGRRHGLLYGGFLHRLVPILEEAQRRGDWRYIATAEKGWLPLEVEDDC
jgi:hypothetical protein